MIKGKQGQTVHKTAIDLERHLHIQKNDVTESKTVFRQWQGVSIHLGQCSYFYAEEVIPNFQKKNI